MKTSTPNLNSDLTGLSGAIELADEILSRGAKLHPNFHIDVHQDVYARYMAARSGRVFEPKELEALFEDSVSRRRREFKMVSIGLEQARDVHRVIARLKETGDLTGSDQLPHTPLKQVPPITVINNIVRGWSLDLGIPNTPHEPTADVEKLEAIANLLLHEAHPDSQEMTTPRRRKLDLPMEEPLLIHTLGRIRDSQDQKENAEICDVSDLDFAITKSAVGAYITLVSQHRLAPSVEGLAELYRRGLLPLGILMKNDAVVEQIALITGREKGELCEAIAKVEETHSVTRADQIKDMLARYEQHLETTQTAREARVASRQQATLKPKHTSVASTKTDSRKLREANALTNEQRALATGLSLVHTSAVLAEDASWIVNHLTLDVLRHPNAVLPNLDGFARDLGGLEERFRVDLEPTNFWFTSAYLQGVYENAAVLTAQLKKPQEILTDSAPESIACFLLVSREVDVFVEAMIAHATLRSLLIQEQRGSDFEKAIKALGSVISDLDRLHLNTLEALRNILDLKQNVCDTSRAWRKIAHNELLSRTAEPGQTVIELDRQSAEQASLLYHTPLAITPALFANQYVGMAWDLTESQFETRVLEMEMLDRDGTVKDIAESLRHSLGTAGIETVHRGYPFKLKISDVEAFAKFVRPVSSRYDVISTDGAGLGLTD